MTFFLPIFLLYAFLQGGTVGGEVKQEEDVVYAHFEWSELGNYVPKRCGLPLKPVPNAAKDVHKFPWAVSVFQNGFFRCTGAIISKRHVLTAASCLRTADDKKLDVCPCNDAAMGYRVGHFGLPLMEQDKVRFSADAKMHFATVPTYSYQVIGIYSPFIAHRCCGSDFAVLELQDILMPWYTNHICLPGLPDKIDSASISETTLYGWGKDRKQLNSQTLHNSTIIFDRNGTKIGGSTVTDFFWMPKHGSVTDICADNSSAILTTKIGARWHLLGLLFPGESCDVEKKDANMLFTSVEDHVGTIMEVIKRARKPLDAYPNAQPVPVNITWENLDVGC